MTTDTKLLRTSRIVTGRQKAVINCRAVLCREYITPNELKPYLMYSYASARWHTAHRTASVITEVSNVTLRKLNHFNNLRNVNCTACGLTLKLSRTVR